MSEVVASIGASMDEDYYEALRRPGDQVSEDLTSNSRPTSQGFQQSRSGETVTYYNLDLEYPVRV